MLLAGQSREAAVPVSHLVCPPRPKIRRQSDFVPLKQLPGGHAIFHFVWAIMQPT